MRYAISIEGSAVHASQFCTACLNQGHTVALVFLYADGVYEAPALPESIPVYRCSASAIERGVPENPQFPFVGLGLWTFEASQADKVITFK
jgi:sulfur relay (sulfurtransferase) complex TusBCD TusD component (DsrE family)